MTQDPTLWRGARPIATSGIRMEARVIRIRGDCDRLHALSREAPGRCIPASRGPLFVRRAVVAAADDADDIGQVLLVGDLLELEAATGEVLDGVTGPMRNARGRVFRQPIQVSRQTVEVVERDLFQVLEGKGPLGYIYKDYEEVWDGEKWVGC